MTFGNLELVKRFFQFSVAVSKQLKLRNLLKIKIQNDHRQCGETDFNYKMLPNKILAQKIDCSQKIKKNDAAYLQ